MAAGLTRPHSIALLQSNVQSGDLVPDSCHRHRQLRVGEASQDRARGHVRQ